MQISIIIPVYHETMAICTCLERLIRFKHEDGIDVEIIVVDGAMERDTLTYIEDWLGTDMRRCTSAGLIRLAHSPQGRAQQMNHGAQLARGHCLLFLHVDTVLPDNALHLIVRAHDDGVKAGAFSLGLDVLHTLKSDGLSLSVPLRIWFSLVERLANVRNKLTKTPYGDQCHFFDTAFFHAMGAYAKLPLMEDVDIMRRLRRAGIDIHIFPQKVITSTRRWHDEGPIYCSMRNLVLRTLYGLGVSANSLARWYNFEKRRENKQ